MSRRDKAPRPGDSQRQARSVPATTAQPVSVYMGQTLQRDLARRAEENKVSLHAEILRRLQASVDQERGA